MTELERRIVAYIYARGGEADGLELWENVFDKSRYAYCDPDDPNFEITEDGRLFNEALKNLRRAMLLEEVAEGNPEDGYEYYYSLAPLAESFFETLGEIKE